MLGIWHESDWMKRDLAQLIYGRVERGSPKPGWILHSLIRVPPSWYFMSECIGLYVASMVVVSLLFMLVICWL